VTATTNRSDPIADHYRTLGIPPHATTDNIEAAYRCQVRRWHPDTNRDPSAAERMVALNDAREILSNPARRADYDRRRLAAQPPRPRLEPAAVDLGTIRATAQAATATVRLFNDGGTVATVRVEPESGPFWALSAVRGGTRPGEVADLDLQPRVRPETARGPHRSILRVIVDNQPVEMALTAWIAQETTAAANTPTAGRPRRRTVTGDAGYLGRYCSPDSTGVLALWPGAPGQPFLARLVNHTGVSIPTSPAGGPARFGSANLPGPGCPRCGPPPIAAQTPQGPVGRRQPGPPEAVSSVGEPHGLVGPGASRGR